MATLSVISLGKTSELKFCNDTTEDVFLSVGQSSEEAKNITVAGWWKIVPSSCREVTQQENAKFIYTYAFMSKSMKKWSGTQVLCTNDYDAYDHQQAEKKDCNGTNLVPEAFAVQSLTQNFEMHFKDNDADAPRSLVDICNDRDEEVFVLLAYQRPDIGGHLMSRGWWSIEPKKCMTAMPVDSDIAYILAEGSNEELLVTGDKKLCVNKKKAFTHIDSESMQCEGENLGLMGFKSEPLQEGSNRIAIK